jgi:hypothetical protein
VLTSPLTTLLILVVGLGVAAVLVVSLLPGWRGARAWLPATLAVVVTALIATAPGAARDGVRGLQYQRTLNANLAEITARERCLNDIGRPDLVAAVALTRERLPEDARFRLETGSQIRPCFTLNVLPRLPVPEGDFDPRQDWIIYDCTAPPDVLDDADPDLVLDDAFVLVPPEGE